MSQRNQSTIRKKLVAWTKFCMGRILGHICHWLMTQWSSIFKAQKSMNLRFCVMSRQSSSTSRIRRSLEEQSCGSTSYRDYDAINGDSTEDSQRCSFVIKSMIVSMFNDIFWDRYDNKNECFKNADLVKTFAWRFLVLVNGHSLDQVLRTSGILQRIVHKEPGTILRKHMLLEFAESGHPTFRVTTPLSKGDVENCRYISLQMWTQLIQFIALSFLSISSLSTEQWQP